MSFGREVGSDGVYQRPATDFCTPCNERLHCCHYELDHSPHIIAEEIALACAWCYDGEDHVAFLYWVARSELAETVEDEDLAELVSLHDVGACGVVELGQYRAIGDELFGVCDIPLSTVSAQRQRLRLRLTATDVLAYIISLPTIVSRPLRLVCFALARILGWRRRASSVVPMTFTAMWLSVPSSPTVANFSVWIPAFSTAASSLSSPSARFANAVTEAVSLMSSCHTSTLSSGALQESKMARAAVWPLETVRTPRMTFEAPRRRMWRAASRPKPVLEPVTMTVWSEKEEVG